VAHDLPRPRVHDRLVGQVELLLLERGAQLGLDVQALQCRLAHRGRERRAASGAAALGLVHRRVRLLQQSLT
jgi:hypothetical protein